MQDRTERLYWSYWDAQTDRDMARANGQAIEALERRCAERLDALLAESSISAEVEEPDRWLLLIDDLLPYLYILYTTHRLCPSIAAWQLHNPQALYFLTSTFPLDPCGRDDLLDRLTWLVHHVLLTEKSGCYSVTPRGLATLDALEADEEEEIILPLPGEMTHASSLPSSSC